ncbi:MAG: hypothetical protein OXI43_13960 [Candidatus Poribacteria bacterium]|nr:hypothetical protein [Candidatus Poribacteria bacterium]
MKSCINGIVLVSIMCIAFLIRIQGASTLPDEMFTGADPYHYYRLAEIISDEGSVPARDMNRWLPLGRDLRQTLNLYPYMLAYTHKVISFVFKNVTLYQVSLYVPAICFIIGLGVLCMFLYHRRGILFASSVGILLATLPGSIDRSTAGFSDRDSWCLMLGIIAVITYLVSLQTHSRRNCLLWTLASGFTCFLGGHSWEGFGIFISIILFVEIWRFLTSETEKHIGIYLLWTAAFVPTLYFTSIAYRAGVGMATHLYAFILIPPLVLLILRVLRHLLLKIENFRLHARALAAGLTLTAIAFTLIFLFKISDTFAITTVPLSQSRLMQSVVELQSAHFNYWLTRYGSVFLIGSFGLFFITAKWKEKQGELFVLPIVLFMITILFQDKLDTLLGSSQNSAMLFFGSSCLCLLTFLFIACTRKNAIKDEYVVIAFIAWFFFWIALARGARRYDFFIGIPLAYFATEIVIAIAHHIRKTVKWKQPALRSVLTFLLLVIILFFKPLGGHGLRSLDAATGRVAFPEDAFTTNSLKWIKYNLKSDAVVAADWSYGSTLNVIAEVKTIVDQDHYIPYWIHLYDNYIHNAKTEREVLEFLKTHEATHILLTKRDPKNSFLRGQLSGAFLPVYPKNIFADSSIKLWKIQYPPDIKKDPRYLETEPSKEY